MRGFGPNQLGKFATSTSAVVSAEFRQVSNAIERQLQTSTDHPVMEWDSSVFLTTLAARVLVTVMFGQSLPAEDEQRVNEAFRLWEEASADPSYYLPGYLDYAPFAGPRAVRKAIKDMHAIAHRCIDKEREVSQSASSEYCSLLSVLVRARDDDGAQLDEDELVHNVYSFFGAGVSTTAHAMRSQLFLLARHPKAQEKLHQELSGGPLEWDFVKKLPYLSAVIAESLRLYPSIQGSSTRDLTSDVVLPSGLHVAKGTSVNVTSLASQRRPAVWGPDADEFRPERFLDGQPEDNGIGNPLHPHKLPPGVPDTAFLAFGYGARPCIGRPLAMIEMKMVLAHAVRQYEIVEMDPEGFEIVSAPPFIFPKRSLKLGLRLRP